MATTDTESGESGEASAEEPRREIGCGVLWAILFLGVLLTITQLNLLSGTWTSCDGRGGPPGDSFPDDGAYIDIFPDALRLMAYVAAGLVGIVVGRRWIRRSGLAGAALRVLVVVAVCAVLFAGDFAWGIRMDPGDYDPAHCPGGVPTWWPF